MCVCVGVCVHVCVCVSVRERERVGRGSGGDMPCGRLAGYIIILVEVTCSVYPRQAQTEMHCHDLLRTRHCDMTTTTASHCDSNSMQAKAINMHSTKTHTKQTEITTLQLLYSS